MIQAETWLPESVLFDGAIAKALGSRVEAWRHHWIAAPGKLSMVLHAAAPPTEPMSDAWRSQCGGLTSLSNRQSRLRLGSAMLGWKRLPRKLNKTDTDLLEALAAQAYTQLLVSLSDLLRTSPDIERVSPEIRLGSAPARRDLRFSVGGSFGRLLELVVSPTAAAAGRKMLVTRTRDLPPLTRRAEAVREHPITIEAYVGASTIDVAELQSLVVGDVIVLDRRIDAMLDVAIGGRAIDSRSLAIARDGASLFIRSTDMEQ